MYLHLGQSFVVHQKDVLGIFDLDNTSASFRTRKFLEKADREGRVITATDDLPKSFVLTSEYGFTRVRLTSLSSSTLEKRLK